MSHAPLNWSYDYLTRSKENGAAFVGGISDLHKRLLDNNNGKC